MKDDTINILAEPVKELVCPECEHSIDVSSEDMLAPVVCPECGAELTVPARLGDFILVEALGSGGMATVYKAYDNSLGRYVAVKIMRRKFGEDPKFVERFLKEARAAARINHPNVVQIYSCATKNGQPYIVMEFVDGGKFDDLIANEAPLAEKRVLEIGLDIANGLRAASDIGLVHGDIKPANIIFDRNGLAKVADFGLAHFAQEQEDRTEIWGTPYYIAPERARKKSQDHRADIYCLGATLFHALAGEPPFDGETAVDVVMERLQHPAPDLSELRPEISPATAKLIGRMLEQDKIRRYPNYNSLISDIEKISGGDRGSETVTGKAVSSRREKNDGGNSGKKSTIGRKLLWSALALIVIVGIGIGAWLLLGREGDENPVIVEPVAVDESPTYQPFDSERSAKLAEILGETTASTASASESALFRFSRGMARNDPRRMWSRLFCGVAAMLQGKNDKAVEYYNDVAEASADEAAAKPPQRLAAYMADERDDALPPEDRQWPRWYTDIALLLEGVKALSDQNTEDALSKLKDYSEMQAGDQPAWPYSLQPFAGDLTSRIEAWERISAEIDEIVANGKLDQAIDTLKKRVRTQLFLPLRDSKIEEIEALKQKRRSEEKNNKDEQRRKEAEARERRRQEEEKRRAEEEQARAAAMKAAREADEKLMEAWEVRSLPLLNKNRFDQAQKMLATIDSKISSDVGKAKLESEKKDLEYLSTLKEFLVAAINSIAYEGAADVLRGKAIAATSNEITVELSGGIGEASYAWSRVEPRLLIRMARFYLGKVRLRGDRRAKIFMGLAVYSEIHDLDMEKAFIGYAEKIKPGIAGDRADKLTD